jgi:hypothetical protein
LTDVKAGGEQAQSQRAGVAPPVALRPRFAGGGRAAANEKASRGPTNVQLNDN